MEETTFENLRDIPTGIGYYEIYRNDGLPIKCGIAKRLRRRLGQHRSSHQNGLRLKPDGDWENPGDVVSTRSILTKHLYYDGELEPALDFTTRDGRRSFLIAKCYICFIQILTIEEAREIEIVKESDFRYHGRVGRRP